MIILEVCVIGMRNPKGSHAEDPLNKALKEIDKLSAKNELVAAGILSI